MNMYTKLKQMPSNLSSARDYITYFIYRWYFLCYFLSLFFIMRFYPNIIRKCGVFYYFIANEMPTCAWCVEKKKRVVLPPLRWFNQFKRETLFFFARFDASYLRYKEQYSTQCNVLVIAIENHVQIFKLPPYFRTQSK